LLNADWKNRPRGDRRHLLSPSVRICTTSAPRQYTRPAADAPHTPIGATTGTAGPRRNGAACGGGGGAGAAYGTGCVATDRFCFATGIVRTRTGGGEAAVAPEKAGTASLPAPYEKSRSQKPAYFYRDLCRFPKVWDAPQGPSGDPSIPEKTGISETLTGVSHLLTAKTRRTWAHEDHKNQGLRQSSVTLIHSFHHRPIGMESVVASKPQAGARLRTGFQIAPIRHHSPNTANNVAFTFSVSN